MRAEQRTPLLSPGHEAEWAKINAEEERQLHESNLALSPSQRLEVGQSLSEQAVELLVAGYRAGLVPARALWS
jgi:mannose/cellobiose epimerase-like protein (N-acyl-D-glucosamine 2-epimerase family)